MADYREIARRMEEGSIVKAVCGDYVVYKRRWLFEHIDQEVTLIRSVKDFHPIVAGVKNVRDWIKEQESRRS